MKKIIFLASFLLLLLPFVSADIALPFSLMTLPFFPLILLVEVIVFWLLINKVFKIEVNFWKSLLIIFAANVVSSLLGTFLLIERFIFNLTIFLLVTFILSAFIEFGIYLLFFVKKKSKKINLLWISFAVNFLTYLGLAVLYLLIPNF